VRGIPVETVELLVFVSTLWRGVWLLLCTPPNFKNMVLRSRRQMRLEQLCSRLARTNGLQDLEAVLPPVFADRHKDEPSPIRIHRPPRIAPSIRRWRPNRLGV